MTERVFLKLGGSLLTDKTRPQVLRADVLARLAREISRALSARPDLQLLVGHGSGSFGHVAATRYGTRAGVHTAEGWRGYAETARAAGELSRLVLDALWDAGVPALRLQPSASSLCRDGELVSLNERPLVVAIEQGLVPVVHGDVSLDEVRGGTILSTEAIFRWLAPRLHPRRVVLAGEVEGVLTADPASGVRGEVISLITPASFPGLAAALGGSRGVDVTGGMMAKVRDTLALVSADDGPEVVRIISGLQPGLVERVLAGSDLDSGTRVQAQL